MAQHKLEEEAKNGRFDVQRQASLLSLMSFLLSLLGRIISQTSKPCGFAISFVKSFRCLMLHSSFSQQQWKQIVGGCHLTFQAMLSVETTLRTIPSQCVVVQHLRSTKDSCLTNEAQDPQVGASFAVHPDRRSHSGRCMHLVTLQFTVPPPERN